MNGHCIVKRSYNNESQKLAKWVNRQRVLYSKGALAQDRITSLESIGFVFRLKQHTDWNVMFNRLNCYKEKHGNCLVPQRDLQLGKW